MLRNSELLSTTSRQIRSRSLRVDSVTVSPVDRASSSMIGRVISRTSSVSRTTLPSSRSLNDSV